MIHVLEWWDRLSQKHVEEFESVVSLMERVSSLNQSMSLTMFVRREINRAK